ncbi:MAG TPA: MgtC/SapB family protein [Candidatus Caccomorpha excrementavium]|nr:MgtC/SapB family protein [Candidatus Caccomorpha excrementavium]
MAEYLIQENVAETAFRLLLALICGGVLGIERGRKNRPAGFRTYMLVCVGAALVMITNEYIYNRYGTGDPTRLGSQVISGIGFLGAGTIIVTVRNRVKGLTTAAGLWGAACMGLAIGAGYYTAAIISCVMIYFVMAMLYRLDVRVMASARAINLYVEFASVRDIGEFIQYVKERDMKITDLELIQSGSVNESAAAILVTIRLMKKAEHAEIIHLLSSAGGVRYMEEVG